MRYFIFIITLSFASQVQAQMSTYWSENFNTKAALLSGAVVGGYEDESSIYYNPSILSDSGESVLTFAAGLFTFDHARFENAVGEGIDASTFTTSVAPSFISLHLYPKDPFKLVWQAALFTKTKYDGFIQKEVRMDYNILQQDPGQEQYLGRFTVRNEYDDIWFGIGAAKFLGDKMSVGASIFGQYKNIRYTYSNERTAMPDLDENPTGHAAQHLEALSVYGTNWRAIVKLGGNFRINENLGVGMVVTVPSFSVLGTGEVIRSVSIINIRDPETGEFYGDFARDERGTKMDVDIKDPMSIAFGVDIKKQDFRINVTAEWFSKINAYRMFDQRTGNFEVSGAGALEFPGERLSVVHGGNNVINFAIGVEQQVTEKRSRIFGFKTNFDARNNFSYGDLEGLNELVDSRSNYYAFSGGTNFTLLNFNILFGLQYSFSRNKGLRQFANYTEPQELIINGPYILEGVPQNTMNFHGNTISLFVSLTLK